MYEKQEGQSGESSKVVSETKCVGEVRPDKSRAGAGAVVGAAAVERALNLNLD